MLSQNQLKIGALKTEEFEKTKKLAEEFFKEIPSLGSYSNSNGNGKSV